MYVEAMDGPFNPPKDITVRGTTELTTDWGAKLEFIDGIVGGVIDMRRFAGSLQKGILEAMQNGPIAGYPVGHDCHACSAGIGARDRCTWREDCGLAATIAVGGTEAETGLRPGLSD